MEGAKNESWEQDSQNHLKIQWVKIKKNSLYSKKKKKKSGSACQDFDSKQFTQLILLLSYISTFLEIAV